MENTDDNIIQTESEEQTTPNPTHPIARTNIPNEKRLILIRAVCDMGMSVKIAAETFEINYAGARSIITKFKKTGNIDKKKRGGKDKSVLKPDILEKIENLVSQNPLITLEEIRRKIIQTEGPGYQISLSTVERGLTELKITVKKIHRELDRVNSPEKILARK
ncbi:hypothetical protein CDIK_3797, partial [Cucumispora dikerogammari]